MKPELQKEATTMRGRGKSIKDIASKLGVSPSTVSRWCQDIVLTKNQRKTLDEKRRTAGIKALQPWIDKNKREKEKDIQTQRRIGAQDIKKLSERDILVLGLGLYWGEGYKRGSQEFGFTNSDPAIICFILKWLEICYQIPIDRINARLTINDRYASEASRLIRVWSRKTKIPVKQFASPTFITGYGKPGRDDRTYLGTLRIKVRNGTSLRRRISASIGTVSDQISLNSLNTAS